MRSFLVRIYNDFFLNWPVHQQRWDEMIYPYKIASVVISIVLAGIMIYLIILIRRQIKESMEIIIESIEALPVPKKKIAKEWEDIVRKVESGNEGNCKLAVIEADKILDDLLKKMGYVGENMSDRLKQITSAQITNINDVWQAHKVRNRLVHEPGFYLKVSDAQRIIEIYQRAFEDLQLL